MLPSLTHRILLGFDVGLRMAERCSRDFPKRMGTELQAIFSIIVCSSIFSPYLSSPFQIVSWLCDPFWKEVFGKSIQKLRTNSRNLYEIEDPSFRMLWVPLRSRIDFLRRSYCLFFPSMSDIAISEHLRPDPTNKGVVAQCVCKIDFSLLPTFNSCIHSYLHMPCGVLRGALHSFGISARCQPCLRCVLLFFQGL
jgi:hypothetical protein